ncbi:MAG: alpha/beta hydrolase family protein [Sphingobacteriales bacterium]
MKRPLITLAFILISCYSFAQSITGDWYGALSVNGTNIPLVFHIAKNGDAYTTTFDSPDQGAHGLATDKTTVAGNQLTIEASTYKITYSGIFMPDSDKIKGTFVQGGGSLPLNLGRTKAAVPAAPIVTRPQDPKDFPYKQEEVVFTNPKGGDQLAGTLTMPSNGKATKIVILITGSGPQNRNEELKPFNHRPFLVWSDWLTRNGIAVLRYDDRGTAQSTGNFTTATSADFADDAEAAVTYVQSRADLKGLSIGLMGHSEGGMIAPIVAARNKAVKFIVLLAGPGVPVTELMLKQVDDQLRLGGATPDQIQRSLAVYKKAYAEIFAHPELPAAQLEQQIDTIEARDLRTFPKEDLHGQSVDKILKTNATLVTPWFRHFLAFNPADYLMKVKCPVLALDGTLDMQVNADANLAAIKAALQKGGNKHFKVVTMDGLNHLFQKATTGSLPEYAQITETVNPLALQTVLDWINEL